MNIIEIILHLLLNSYKMLKISIVNIGGPNCKSVKPKNV